MSTVRTGPRVQQQQQPANVEQAKAPAPETPAAPSTETAQAPDAAAAEPARAAPTAQVLDETRAARSHASSHAQAQWLGRAAQIATGLLGNPLAPVVGEAIQRGVDHVRNQPAAPTSPPVQAQAPSTAPAPATPAPSGTVAPAANTPPPLPAGSYDVATVSTADIKAMKGSKDAKTRAMGNTIANAQVAYKDQIASGARVVVNSSAGNGGQPVLTLIPKGFDYNKPARVHTHYHGWSATVADPMGQGSGTTARMKEVQAKDPQTVFVLPECKNAPADASLTAASYKTDWSNVSSQAKTTDDALAGSGITSVGKTVVSAHSGGGSALANAMNANKDGSGVKADRLELQDCFYGSESTIAKWAKTPNGQSTTDVLYYRGTNDHSDKAVADAFGKAKYKKIDMAEKGKITAADNPVLVGDDGNPITAYGKPKTKFAPDNHNRTVGQFMDSEPGP